MASTCSYRRAAVGLLRGLILLAGAGFLLAAPPQARAQVYPNSPVFRDYRPPREGRDARTDGLRRQINLFMLERDAAKGDPIAQHELGVRYLLGRGVRADTALSAEWLQRAAEQNLPPAMYNYALLLSNGWAGEWNPYAAYRYFLRAAEAGMAEAEYMVGIFHTDGLAMPQDWQAAYRWLSRAAEAGYEPAKHARGEIIRRGHVSPSTDSAAASDAGPPAADAGPPAADAGPPAADAGPPAADAGPPAADADPATGWKPILLDFRRDTTTRDIPTALLLQEYLASAPFSTQDSLRAVTLIGDAPADSALLQLRRMTEAGNPEALVLRGRLREEGRSLPADRIAAAADYASAIYLESMRAPQLLLQLLRSEGFAAKLARAAWGGDADAQYVWAALRGLEFDLRLTESMAHDMLRRSAEAGNARALVMLGVWQSAGRWEDRDMAKAEQLWQEAARLRSGEARVRLAAAAVLGTGSALRVEEAMPLLETAAEQGSLIALVALAYSYQRGIGRAMRKGEAVRLYRDAAYRGSQSAYRALRGMHEAVRREGNAGAGE